MIDRKALTLFSLLALLASPARGEDGKAPSPEGSEFYRRLRSLSGVSAATRPDRPTEEEEDFGPREPSLRTVNPDVSGKERPEVGAPVHQEEAGQREGTAQKEEEIQIPAPGERPSTEHGIIAPADPAPEKATQKQEPAPPVPPKKKERVRKPEESRPVRTPEPARVPTSSKKEKRVSTPEIHHPEKTPPPAAKQVKPIRENQEDMPTPKPPMSVRPVNPALPPALGSISLNDAEPETLEKEEPSPPVDRGNFVSPSPQYYRGIYVNNAFFRSKHFPDFLKTASAYGMNTLVIDIQPTMPSAEVLKQIHEAGFYTVARLVCFPNGLGTYPANPAQIDRILDRAELGAKAGFGEIQLDYIRFADNLQVKGLTLERRYRYMGGILRRFEDRLRPYRVRVGADIFGRIAFNQNDIIGQKLEVFDAHLDTIYPMLYPSHFYGEPIRRRLPYRTILEGARDSRQRVKNSRIVPYIQAFMMRVSESGLSLDDYIRAQIDGAKDSGAGGFIVWNARNDYQAFFRALKKGRLVKAPPPGKRNR